MAEILLLSLGALVLIVWHLPHDMLQDFWNMLWKKDLPDD
jgi:hypothetical protein